MVLATDPNERAAMVHGRLTYNGDVSKTFDTVKPYGPSTMNEMYWGLSAEYSPELNKTVVLFTQVPPDEYLRMMGVPVE